VVRLMTAKATVRDNGSSKEIDLTKRKARKEFLETLMNHSNHTKANSELSGGENAPI
jgi:hypothetical protein